mgnify:CR=1 FL=1
MLEPKVNNFEHSEKPEIEIHETDILIIGGGMAACGCAFECDRWATPQGMRTVSYTHLTLPTKRIV